MFYSGKEFEPGPPDDGSDALPTELCQTNLSREGVWIGYMN